MTSRRASRSLLSGISLAVVVAAAAPRASAQTPDELSAARSLFQEAYKDEQEKRFEPALEKFRRVAKVRESASVRYRIASVLEQLGRLRESRDAFRALASSRDTLKKEEQEIAESSAERAVQVDKKIPRLVVKTPESAPPDARVTVDGAAVPISRPLELDPGDHVVHASATGMKPFEQHVKLVGGGETPLLASFEAAAGGDKSGGDKSGGDKSGGSGKTLGYVALGVGGVVLVTGVALLVVRASDITYVEDHCPNDVCPTASQKDIVDKQDEAKLFGPLGATLGVVGAVSAGIGIYLITRPSTSSDPNAAPATGALRIGPRPVPGGAILGAGVAF